MFRATGSVAPAPPANREYLPERCCQPFRVVPDAVVGRDVG
jgi:hypothetical protein